MSLRFLALTSIALALLILGYCQYLYVFNFTNSELPVFIDREENISKGYALKGLLFGEDPRMYSMLFYALASFALVLSFIKIFFQENLFVKWTVWIYLAAYVVGIVLMGILFLLSKGSEGFLLFQKIKNGLSSPFILCFLIPIFIYSKKIESNS